jgi:hypothetical protein
MAKPTKQEHRRRRGSAAKHIGNILNKIIA